MIIPHYLGDVLSACVRSVHTNTQGIAFEVIVVDDGPHDDGSVARVIAEFPDVRVKKSRGGGGFGAACNVGIAAARGRYLAILNNDVEVAPGWMRGFLAAAEADPAVGVFQAKLRSIHDRRRFDYSGGAGGLIDRLGYPLALGRVFDSMDIDSGQNDPAQRHY